MTERIRIVVADDHSSFRESLVHLLSLVDGIEVVGEAADGLEASRTVLDLRPDVVVLDLNMPAMDGAQTARQIKVEAPEVGVIILSVFSESQHIRRSLEAGADRYLTKGISTEELLAAIKAVAGLEPRPAGLGPRVATGIFMGEA